jgi:hypothetical protein
MHYRDEYGGQAWVFLTIFFYYMIIHFHMNYTLYECAIYFLEEQYFFFNIQAAMEGDYLRMPHGCYEYVPTRIVLRL